MKTEVTVGDEEKCVRCLFDRRETFGHLDGLSSLGLIMKFDCVVVELPAVNQDVCQSSKTSRTDVVTAVIVSVSQFGLQAASSFPLQEENTVLLIAID